MSGEKNHDPTQKRLNDARKRGEVSQSKEIPILLKYVAFLFIVAVGFDSIWLQIREVIAVVLGYVQAPDSLSLADVAMACFRLSIPLLFILVFGIAVTGMMGIFMQIGVLFSSEAAAPSLKKFNVINNVKQMFSLQTLLQLLLSVLKVVVFFLVTVMWLRTVLGDTLRLQQLMPGPIGDFTREKIQTLISLAVMLFVSFAALDWMITRFFFMKNMRMSHQDLIDEYKQTEGDPHVKQHRRQEHRSILNGSLNRTANAKLVVNNPTHISVALDYEPGIHDLPFILAMETDDMALQMRRRAQELGIPMVTHIELARALYRDGEVDAYIPSAHVSLTAEVFRAVLEAFRQSTPEEPHQPPDIGDAPDAQDAGGASQPESSSVIPEVDGRIASD